MIEPHFLIERMPRARWKQIRRKELIQEKWLYLICATISVMTSALSFAAGVLVAREYFLIPVVLVPCALLFAIFYCKHRKQLKNFNE